MEAQTIKVKEFKKGSWCDRIDVLDFILQNYKEYKGDSSFLANPTEDTIALREEFDSLLKKERDAGGVLDLDTAVPSTILSHKPGYLIKGRERVVGLQTDKPLKRALMPFGGISMAVNAAKSYGYDVDPELIKVFKQYRKTHNDGVFDVYTPEMRAVRKSGVITGLPDAYGRGRIIGDYRRVPLYGVDRLIEEKEKDKAMIGADGIMTDDVCRDREEVSEQVKALKELKELALLHGFDVSRPAENSREAVQWLYFAYLAAIKQQNGAAMSVGNVATFLDCYFERDLEAGLITEEEVQELIDHLVIKFRCVKFARTPAYNELFSGDPVWVTLVLGEMKDKENSLVTKTDFRFIHTLTTLGNSPEPNLTVLWSDKLPRGFKEYCAENSILYSSIQYENDFLLQDYLGSCDKSIACCVSGMRTGKDLQFFGARANLVKALLYTINGGRDEVSGLQVGPKAEPMHGVLDYDTVMKGLDSFLEWLCRVYVQTLNVIHWSHDKYCYESLELALHDTNVRRLFATGIAGLSVAADSLSAIKYATVETIQDETGLVIDYKVTGDYPRYGNDDDRADSIAIELLRLFDEKLQKQKAYRADAITTSVLTITSNLVYGKATGASPAARGGWAGRKDENGELIKPDYSAAFSPGANPMNGADTSGALASLNSVAKLPFKYARDGISLTSAFSPASLGKTDKERINTLVAMMDGYFKQGGFHLNVNVFNKEELIRVAENPHKYPNFSIRVSGYAVRFINLTPDQQRDVMNRVIHQFR